MTKHKMQAEIDMLRRSFLRASRSSEEDKERLPSRQEWMDGWLDGRASAFKQALEWLEESFGHTGTEVQIND